MRVAHQRHRQVRCDVAAQIDAVLARADAERLHEQTDGIAQRKVPLLERQLPGLDLREIEYVVDDGQQTLG